MSAHIVSAGVLGSRIFIGVYVFYCALLISYKTICNVPWKKHTESIDGNITSVIAVNPASPSSQNTRASVPNDWSTVEVGLPLDS